MTKDNDLVLDFDFINFEKNWLHLDQDQQCQLLECSSEFSPSQAILPIIAGLSSYHYMLRNKAREALAAVQEKMIKLQNDKTNKKEYLKAILESDCFCSRIFLQIKPGIALPELNFYFQALIKSEGKGPFYAWKACYSNLISIKIFRTLISSLFSEQKLVLTAQYLKSTPQIRKDWAIEFKKMLQQVNDKHAIVCFLARIFDQENNLDPFLLNIPLLKDMKTVLSRDLFSKDIKIRGRTIKALSLMQDCLDIDFLIKSLKTEKKISIKIIILQAIESSFVGIYSNSKLSGCLLDILRKRSPKEAFHAFKALVITKGIPLYKLFIEVIKNRKDILLEVLNEISSFSRISFCIIQDVAQNKKKYLKNNALVFNAYILGVVRKRPERVINLLKKFEDHSDDLIRTQVSEFIELIGQLLAKEKKGIEKEIESLVKSVNDRQKSPSGIFKDFFLSSTDKKLIDLKESKFPGEFEFEAEIIENVDLSNLEFLNYILYFNNAIIKNTSFTSTIITGSFFKNTMIYNVDFSEAEFDGVCFDNAVFIDINASNAKFNNCSFCNASFYNSRFNNCDLHNSIFTGSKFIKTSFDHAELSGVSFVGANFILSSFKDSIFDLSDFTGVKARYSKFDDFAEDTLIDSFADFNARDFKINLDSIPYFSEEIISHLEMLVFVEFLYYGEKLFLKKNKLSKLIAFDIYRGKQGDLFELIPLLLHENINLPGTNSVIKNCPHGIAKYLPSNEIKKIADKYLNTKQFKLRKNSNYCIEGLYTIGSTGSLAQTTQSDFDFWVVIRDDCLSQKTKKALILKLRLIEKWADKNFNTEVNFFLLDIDKAINNDFGSLSFESSGSAQARLLKEEFYRTLIYVAGKLPLWTVLSVPVSIYYYNDISNFIRKTSLQSKYINLGDIHGIPSGEYFGASIWHMYKLLKSPFKSVIKMALLEKFIYEYGKEPLLCNKIKDIWINSGNQLKLYSCDPYYILIHGLIKFYESIDDLKSVNLIQICFFLKLKISKTSDFENTLFGIKGQFINKLIQEWAITSQKIFEIGNYQNWEYKAIERLSSNIENYMIGKMRMMNKFYENAFKKDSKITPEERTVLVRNVVVEFSKEKGKIDRVLLVSKNYNYFQRLSLQLKEVNKKDLWEIIVDRQTSMQLQKGSVRTAETIEELGAWLINNGFYTEKSIINLVPNPTFVTHNDIVLLMNEMYKFFRPIMQKQRSFKSLIAKAEIVAVFVSLNLYVNKSDRKIKQFSVVYINSWNEMFIYSKSVKQGFDGVDSVTSDIFSNIGIKRFPLKTIFFSPNTFGGKIETIEDLIEKY